jgi:tetratricopeptide (TPR) repeat protein
MTLQQLVADGQAALVSGDFDAAEAALTAAVTTSDSPDARLLLGIIAFANEDFGQARDHWEEAFRRYRDADDHRAAARAATFLGMLHYDGFGNESASHGWLSRAGRLLDRSGRCVERGYLELALVACNARDVSALEESAAVALDLAIEFNDADLEARALADGGLALISQGQLAKGFARLDEAMAPVSAGEVRNPMIGGTIFCALLTACERTGELRRAEEWSRACNEFTAGLSGRLPVLHAHCRLAYGTVLCDAGRWPEAEAEMTAVLGPASTACIPKMAEAAGALASLRLMQGRLDEAAELLLPYADRFEVCEPLARLYFERGELDLSAAVIDRALHDLVGDRLRAGRLLRLLVEVDLARRDVDAAERSAERLSDYADDSDSTILLADARLADARVATYHGNSSSAVGLLREAQEALRQQDRPLMAALVDLELARALMASGHTTGAVDEARAALSVYQRVGATRGLEAASSFLKSIGPEGRQPDGGWVAGPRS